MADKDLIIKEKVEHTGLMDFKGLYSFSHSWFKEEGFGVDETKYSEKSDGSSRDISIEWKITKSFSDYFKVEYKVVFRISKLTEVEAEIDGVKKRMNQGKVEVEISGALIRDPDSKWDKTAFSRFTREIYNKYLIPSRISDMKMKVAGDVRKFKEELKAFLDLVGRR